MTTVGWSGGELGEKQTERLVRQINDRLGRDLENRARLLAYPTLSRLIKSDGFQSSNQMPVVPVSDDVVDDAVDREYAWIDYS